MSEKEKDGSVIRVDLNAEDTVKFKSIQTELGVKNKAEVFRFCLTFAFDNYKKIVNTGIEEIKENG